MPPSGLTHTEAGNPQVRFEKKQNFLQEIFFFSASSPRLTVGAALVSANVAPAGKLTRTFGNVHTVEAVSLII